MAKAKTAAEARLPDLDGIKPHSLSVWVHPERRNLAVRKALVRRMRAEFQEMRGLSLTLCQAARLFGVPQEACARILRGLTEEGLLRLTADGRYVLRGEKP